jgi:hypothetical protein
MVDTLHGTEKLSAAALISVILRRKISRTIDIKWLIENEAYAKSIIALSREQGLTDLNEYVDHFEMLMFGKLSNSKSIKENQYDIKNNSSIPPQTSDSDEEVEMADSSMYIGGLR